MNITALYTVPELAEIMGLTRWQTYRLIRYAGIDVHCVGRRMYVPLSELQLKAPSVWESLVTATAFRDACIRARRQAL